MPRRQKEMHEPPNIPKIEQLLEAVIGMAERLHSAVAALPDADEEGNSECPFAEDLYAAAEELRAEVESWLEQLEEHLTEVGEEIGRIKGDLTVVSAHQDQLHGDRAREHFSQAEVELAALYKRYLALRDRLEEVIEAVKEILQEAAGKKWPGGKPRRRGEVDPENAPPPKRLVPLARPGGADQELQDLMEMEYRPAKASTGD